VIVGTNGNHPQEERAKFGCNSSTIVDMKDHSLQKGVDIRSLLTKGATIFMDKKRWPPITLMKFLQRFTFAK
jgi:hypothetical protein